MKKLVIKSQLLRLNKKKDKERKEGTRLSLFQRLLNITHLLLWSV